MSFLTFNYNKNLNYAIVYWALEITYRLITNLEWEYFQIIKNDAINEYIYLMLLNISDLLAGFLVLYINCSLKGKHSIDDTIIHRTKSVIEMIKGKEKTINKTKSYIQKFILVIVLDYLNRLIVFIFYISNKTAEHDIIYHKAQKDIIIHLDIIIRYILSIFLLKIKIFKHHKFSFFLILINFLILIPTDAISLHFYTPNKDEKLTYIYIGMYSIRAILYPYEDVIIKKLFKDDYILPEYLMFFRGVGELILILFLTPIFYFTLCADDILTFNEDIIKIVLTIILYTLAAFVKSYLLFKVIYYFSAQSVSFLIISESIACSVAEIIKYFNQNSFDDINIINLFIEIIVILNTTFGTLVYDEIIIIKKFGMNVNVRTEITLRGKLEVDSIGVVDNESDGEEEDEDLRIDVADNVLYD